jgi:hypothetical protein
MIPQRFSGDGRKTLKSLLTKNMSSVPETHIFVSFYAVRNDTKAKDPVKRTKRFAARVVYRCYSSI